EDVAAYLADDTENFGSFLRNGIVFHQIAHGELVAAKLTNGQGRAVDRKRRHDDVHTAAIGKTRIADRARFVHATADLTHDPLTDIHQLTVVAETDIGQFDLAVHFD